MKKKCNTCNGFGLWEFGEHTPMGDLDAKEGYYTLPCPECKANANPRKVKA